MVKGMNTNRMMRIVKIIMVIDETDTTIDMVYIIPVAVTTSSA